MLKLFADGKRIAHFRGRELHGKALKVPDGYRGVLVERRDAPKPEAQRLDEPEVVDLEADEELPVGALETQAQFDEMVIWGHEQMAEAVSDPYARGVEEWMQLSSQVREHDRFWYRCADNIHARYIHILLARYSK